jgi:AraC family transcriptional regulator, chitin signaling transcriptional activator
MKLFRTLQCAFYFALPCCLSAFGQEISPIQNYTPKTYGAGNQNWKISQGLQKQLYFANNEGLLEFNGAYWQLYKSPNNSIMRSVKVIDSLVFTGCHMEFGFWKKDAFGKLNYTSISNKLKTPMLEDEEFWGVIDYEKWVLFQSLKRIYIYDTEQETFKIIDSESVLEKIFKVENTIYYQKINDGLYKIENGEEVLVSKEMPLRNNIIVDIYTLEGTLILVTRQDGFYVLQGKTLEKWRPKSESTLSKTTIYSSKQLSDGSLVIGTISNGIFHLNKEGSILQHINQEKGLNNNTVLSIYEDKDQNIWLGLDNGISVLNFNSPFKAFNDLNGKLGAVYTSVIHNENLYLGTNQGLFYRGIDSSEDFNFIQGTKGQVWCLKKIKDALFCGHNSGTFLIENGLATLIASVPGTWDLKKISISNELLLQGNYNGLYVLEKKEGAWGVRNKIEGFENSCRFFELASENKLFVSHEHKGIFKLKINKEFTKVLEFSIEKLSKGKKSSLIKYRGDLLYSLEEGLFTYDYYQESFVKDSVLTKALLKDETFVSGKLIVTKNKRLWGFTDKNIVYLQPGKLNKLPQTTKVAMLASIRGNYFGYENLTHLKDNIYLIGTSNGYLILDTDGLKDKTHDIQINTITKGPLGGKKTNASLKEDAFEYAENSIGFHFSVPVYEKYSEVKYRYKLKGLYQKWSDWSSESKASFTNLPFGEYTFYVKAKIANHETSNTATFTFKIGRPWYLSNLMIASYSLLFMGIIFTVHTVNKNYYRKQEENLIKKKQSEFEKTQLENEKVIMKLKNDKLRDDIESKNRELAASTMSIIKKNEFLNTIKKELIELKDNEMIKPVIKIIDKNLNVNSDWELFQEAFNNADKDFLKKVKEKHPSLTPNDLRLCAYLRLNLSSKEIAPLLNISHKSVEIKRYRLRKKMELGTKVNLIHHILDI